MTSKSYTCLMRMIVSGRNMTLGIGARLWGRSNRILHFPLLYFHTCPYYHTTKTSYSLPVLVKWLAVVPKMNNVLSGVLDFQTIRSIFSLLNPDSSSSEKTEKVLFQISEIRLIFFLNGGCGTKDPNHRLKIL